MPNALLLATGTDIGRVCDALIRAHNGTVTHFEQHRASHLPLGIPDREYCVFGYTIAYEIKAPTDKLTRAQYAMLEQKKLGGQVASCGGLEELSHLVPALRRSLKDGQSLGWLFTALWAARGFRPQR